MQILEASFPKGNFLGEEKLITSLANLTGYALILAATRQV